MSDVYAEGCVAAVPDVDYVSVDDWSAESVDSTVSW